MLTSQKHFPSRLTLGTESQGGTQGGFKTLANIYRRVYRMFAHAWFQHREAFERVEREGGVYVLFKRVCDLYSLIPEDNYTIPPEAEGSEGPKGTAEAREEPKAEEKREKSPEKGKASVPSGTVRHDQAHEAPEPESPTAAETPVVKDAPTPISTAATTRKHRHTPSTGSLVTTIFEGEGEGEGEEDYSAATDEKAVSPPMQTAIPILPSTDFKPLELQKEPAFEEGGEDLSSNKALNVMPAELEKEDAEGEEGLEGKEVQEEAGEEAVKPAEAVVAEREERSGDTEKAAGSD